MEMENFCSSMRNEMKGWKTKTQDLVKTTEETSPTPNEKLRAAIDDMRQMIDRIERTLGKLEVQCPADWNPEKAEIEQTICDIRARWNESASLSPDDFE